MKNAAALLLLFFISLHTYGQQSKAHKEIQSTVINFFDGIARLDDAAIKAEVTDDFSLVEHGLILNVDSIISWIRPVKGTDLKRVNTIVFNKIEQIGDMAIVVYHNTANMTKGDKQKIVKWLESAVLVKQNGAWKIKLLHSTDLK